MLVWESYDWWAKVDGRQNHLRDVAGGSVVLDTAILIESSSLFGWPKWIVDGTAFEMWQGLGSSPTSATSRV